MSVLIIDEHVRSMLATLRETAQRNPVDILALMMRIKTPIGKIMHRQQMTAQTVKIPGPYPYLVTFSIENGHPGGDARHLSMSIQRENRVPNDYAVWMIAEELGFVGSLRDCVTYSEDLAVHGKAVNVIQIIT